MSAPTESKIVSFLAQLIDQIRSTPFSKEDRSIVRQHLLDAIASAFIGCRRASFQDLAKLCSKGEEGSAWPGSGHQRVSPLDGAMLWAFAINGSVYEDGSREGACHPSAVIIPTVLALSEGRNWEEIDRAIVSGYEVMVRLAKTGNPHFTRSGFHPTAIIAPFGAAATVSSLMGYDSPKTGDALCLAAMGGAGWMASFRRGETQPLQVAWSVRNGIVAAKMAGVGHSGYPRILEEGFYPGYLGDHPASAIDQPLEKEYAFQGSYLKPYPGCRHVHPSIDALAEILKGQQVAPSQIEKIRVRTYRIAVETEIHEVKTRGDAYFNIAYALAARIILGRNDWDAFDEKHFKNKDLVQLMKKIEAVIDPEVESHYPHERGSRVEMELTDGKVLQGGVRHALGEPENPLPSSVTVEKFREAASDFLTKKNRDRVETLLDVSGPIESPKTLFDALSGC